MRCNKGGYVRLHNLDTVVKTTHLAATYSTQPQWGVLHKSTIEVSPDPLFPREGLASETSFEHLGAAESIFTVDLPCDEGGTCHSPA